jgi:hypothetical protein
MLRAHGFNRVFGATATAVAVVVGMAAFGASPSVSAPAEDCAVPFPISDLTDGQAVSGLTVSKGTTPEPFTGEFIGVINDGIAPGVDMVMARLTSSEIDRVGGIWAGMSGSPVYAADGRLIGAVAYGLAGTTPVAGITPFEEMDDYVGPSIAPRVRVSSRTAAKIASSSDVSAADASDGFRQLPLLTSVTGVSPQRLSATGGDRKYLKSGVRSAGALSGSSAPDADTVVAGGNLGAAVSWGDIVAGGVGTATSVCNGKVVGFGHPLEYVGKSTAALLPASAVYIQENPADVPFKVANFGPPVGSITEDRLTGISGAFGDVPKSFKVTDDLTYGSRHRTGTSEFSVKDYDAEVTFYQQVASHDSVLRAASPGSEVRSWTISGKSASGSPFSLALRNRYTSDYDIGFEVPWDVADQVYALSSLKGVTLDSVDITGTVSDDTSSYRVAKVQQYRAGAWQTISRSRPIYGHPGQYVNIRTALSSESGPRFVSSKVKIPTSARGTKGSYTIGGIVEDVDDDEYFDDEEEYEEYPTGSLSEILAYYRKQRSTDQLYGSLRVGGRTVSFKTNPADKIVYGSVTVPVRVALR